MKENLVNLKLKYRKLIERKNQMDENWYNGIFDRYENPVLTN